MKKYAKYTLLLMPAVLCASALIFHNRENPVEMRSIPAATEEERLAFLRSEGWEGALVSSQTVTIPAEDSVFAEYADLQRKNLLPLENYTGTQGILYVYSLRNTELHAELLTADGMLIGAQCYDPELHTTLDMRGNAP